MNQHWVILVIPLIAFAVWLLSNLIKEAEEPVKDRRSRDSDPGRPRRSSSDLDRFLAQQRQRRPETDRPRDPIAEPFAPAGRQPSEPREPARAERPRERPARDQSRPSRPREAPPAAQTTPRRLVLDQAPTLPVQAKPVILELAREPAAGRSVPPSPRPASAPAAPAPEPAPVSALRAPNLAPTISANAPLPPLGQFLRSPQSARLAFILREIIDAPLCQRRHKNS